MLIVFDRLSWIPTGKRTKRHIQQNKFNFERKRLLIAKQRNKKLRDANLKSWLTILIVLQFFVEGPCVIHPEVTFRPKGRYS